MSGHQIHHVQRSSAVAPQFVTREQLMSMVSELSRRPGRSILAIDGYPASGKTTLAMAVARLPAVEWVPLDAYRRDASFDFRRLEREILKPFRKRGRVRRVAANNPLGRKGALAPRAEHLDGQQVLVLEGMESALAARAMGVDYLCWVDCAQPSRRARLDARATPGGTFVELQDWIERAEQTGLRDQVLSVADFVVDTSTRRVGPGQF